MEESTNPRVFLSSTSEFDAVYPSIVASLRSMYTVWYWKEEVALSASPESHCKAMIKGSQVAVFLLGYKYGTEYEAGCSICEWEFKCALGPPTVPGILAFVKDGWESNAETPQIRHISQITHFHNGLWCKPFGDENTLITHIEKAIHNWHIKYLLLKVQEMKFKNKVFYYLLIAFIVLGLSLALIVYQSHAITLITALICAISIISASAAAMIIYQYSPK